VSNFRKRGLFVYELRTPPTPNRYDLPFGPRQDSFEAIRDCEILSLRNTRNLLRLLTPPGGTSWARIVQRLSQSTDQLSAAAWGGA